MPESHEITIRVRYAETDRMGLLHHANYFVYFEMGRTELLRQRGLSYRDIEDAGHLLVIVDLGCKFKRPAYYDDLLTLRTTVERVTHVKIVHRYEVLRDGVLLAEGHSTLACVDREGKPQALPETARAGRRHDAAGAVRPPRPVLPKNARPRRRSRGGAASASASGMPIRSRARSSLRCSSSVTTRSETARRTSRRNSSTGTAAPSRGRSPGPGLGEQVVPLGLASRAARRGCA